MITEKREVDCNISVTKDFRLVPLAGIRFSNPIFSRETLSAPDGNPFEEFTTELGAPASRPRPGSDGYLAGGMRWVVLQRITKREASRTLPPMAPDPTIVR